MLLLYSTIHYYYFVVVVVILEVEVQKMMHAADAELHLKTLAWFCHHLMALYSWK